MAITLDQAKTHLSIWLQAEQTVAVGGQNYQIGTRSLTRANLREIREQITYWSRKVATLEAAAKGRGRNRIIRVVPRDL